MSAVVIQSESVNHLLAALPEDEYKSIALELEAVSLELSQILHRQDEVIDFIYFPQTAIVSLLTDLQDGSGIEVGLVGKEGMVGLSVILGVARSSKVATVQGAGTALRMRASQIKEAFARGGKLQRLLLRYTYALMAQISQSAACNRRHSVEGRLARWLLMYQDRASSDTLELTQDFLANMLGCRRAGVSEAAQELELSGFIRQSRGRITIIDREGMEDFTCECYRVVKNEYDQILEAE